MNTTTKRYPRTINEAFGTGTEYACAIERGRRADTSGKMIVLVALALLAGCYLMANLWGAA